LDELNFTNSFKEKFKKLIIKILMKITYPKAKLIIGISTKLSRDLSAFVKTKVKTVYSPSFDMSIIPKSNKALKLSKKYNYILNVSRFSKRKDHETTLKAFKIVVEKHKNTKLILIGYGPEKKNIINMAKNLKIYNKIIIINKTYNPYPFMKKSMLLILTSIYEGFPNVLVESLTIGTPVISTNMNAGASEILINGKGGELINLGDYINLSKKIILFLNSPRLLRKKTRFGQNKLHRFSAITHSKIYSKIFKKI
jgi:glycosyltransferase involved in cell wall biosynthesis